MNELNIYRSAKRSRSRSRSASPRRDDDRRSRSDCYYLIVRFILLDIQFVVNYNDFFCEKMNNQNSLFVNLDHS